MRFLKKNRGCCLLLLCIFLLFFLWGCSSEERQMNDPQSPHALQPVIKITAADRDVQGSDPVRISLDEQEDEVYIRQKGTYLLEGTLKGSIHVDAEEQIVQIILQNVTVDSVDGPALYVHSAGKVILTLAENTVNTFQDAASYGDNEEADACIYSENDLTINGSGILNVYGYYKDAIHTKDVLKVLGGSVFAQSKRDGLRGNDGVLLLCMEGTVQSERNGICTTKRGKPGKGNIEILDGTYSVIGGQYAIHAAQDLYVNDCSVFLYGIVDHFMADGTVYIQEGCLTNG